MKKIYSLLLIASLSANLLFAGGAGCTIDQNNTQFFSPSPDSIPCIERNVVYNQVIQIAVPSNYDVGPLAGLPAGLVFITVDSLVIDSLTGLPSGITYIMNPANGFFLGGENGCANVSGTTTATAGNYPLTVHGRISVSGIPGASGLPPDTTFDLSALAGASGGMFSLGVDVIEQGEPCRPAASGVNSFSNELNSLLSVYPNPNSGIFEVRLNAGRRLNGQLLVLDATGRTVYNESIDVIGLYNNSIDISRFAKGIYTIQVRTDEGHASKSISVE